MAYQGSVKSFNPQKGFGFIECDETFSMYGKDIFVLKTALPGGRATQGDQVSFNVQNDYNGPVAIDVQAVSARGAGTWPRPMRVSRTPAESMVPAGIAKLAQRSSPTFDPTYETSFVGTVKSFNHKSGWGMIECPLTMQLHGKDVFVSKQNVEGGDISQGDQVRFVVKMEDKGPAAVCVQPLKRQMPQMQFSAPYGAPFYGGGKGGYSMPAPPMMQWGPADASPPKHAFFGVLKAYNEEKGWGHISCDATMAMYNKDVFLLKNKCGGFNPEPGMLVSFKVHLGAKGPQAEQLTALPPGSFSTDEQQGNQHSGTIKSFNEDKGWGFIAGDELREIFGKDIFINKRELGYAPSVGDKVSFTVSIGDKDGQPQAKNIVHEAGNAYNRSIHPMHGNRPEPY